jgi:hypothetical protein
MKRLSALVVACGFVFGCYGSDGPTGPGPIAPPTVYNLSGYVRDQAGLAVSGATVEIPAVVGHFATTDATGYFSLGAVRGSFGIRVRKDGYAIYSRSLYVSSDQEIDVTLSKVEFADSIVLGRTVRTSVRASTPPCDPERWDALAPCQRFSFTSPISGKLLITVKWIGGPSLDAAFMSPAGSYIAFSEDSGFEQFTLLVYVDAGAVYEVRVHSYYGGQMFDLSADLSPLTGNGS